MADRIIQMKDNQGNNLFPLVKISPSILEGNYLPITGGTLTGDLILKGDPTSLLMPATKQYVDNGFTTKQYVDNKFGDYALKTGTNATGTWPININGNASTATDLAGNTAILAVGVENNEISMKTNGNGAIGAKYGTSTSASLRNAIDFRWYNTHWQIGNMRGGSDNSDGFGIAYQETPNSAWVLGLRVAPGGVTYGACWNDYAEYRKSDDDEPGRVVMEDKKGILQRVTERLQSFAGVVSDTFGFSQGETDEAKTPLAVAGRVLVYPYRPKEEYNPGDCVCAAPDGTVDIMTRQEIRDWPDRIVGTVSEIPGYETWGTGNVEVNGRIWIKVR